MAKNERIHYYVEGKCEKSFLDAFKVGSDAYFKPGKVTVFNFVNERISIHRLRTLSINTTIVLIYDVNVENTKILEENLQTLKACGLKEIIHIQSINSFEDEILRSTEITDINDVFNTENVEQFKSSFIKHKDIKSKLINLKINLDLFWAKTNIKEPFAKYSSATSLLFIRIKQKSRK